MKYAVIGSRTFNNYPQLVSVLNKLLTPNDIIISGGAIGADSLAKKYAEETNHQIIEFIPDWEKFGRSAGFKRNIQIVDASNIIIAFHDGTSKGTQNSLDYAKKMKKPCFVIYF